MVEKPGAHVMSLRFEAGARRAPLMTFFLGVNVARIAVRYVHTSVRPARRPGGGADPS